MRKKLKDKLGVGEHAGRRSVLVISYGTPQMRFDVELLKIDLTETALATYMREYPVRDMEFKSR